MGEVWTLAEEPDSANLQPTGEDPGKKTFLFFSALESPPSASQRPNPTGIKRAKGPTHVILEGTIKDYPTRHRASGEEWRVADGEHTTLFFSVPDTLADWGSQRSFAEANPRDLIRHISKRLTGPALSSLAAPHKVDKFLVLPITTKMFCNIVISAEGTVKAMASRPPRPAALGDPVEVAFL